MRARGTGRKPRSASNDRVLGSSRSTDRGAWHYARGLAYASKRDRKNLIAELDSLTAIVDKLPAGHQGSIRSGLGPCRRAAEPAILLDPRLAVTWFSVIRKPKLRVLRVSVVNDFRLSAIGLSPSRDYTGGGHFLRTISCQNAITLPDNY